MSHTINNTEDDWASECHLWGSWWLLDGTPPPSVHKNWCKMCLWWARAPAASPTPSTHQHLSPVPCHPGPPGPVTRPGLPTWVITTCREWATVTTLSYLWLPVSAVFSTFRGVGLLKLQVGACNWWFCRCIGCGLWLIGPICKSSRFSYYAWWESVA